jgi:hypothetical protein
MVIFANVYTRALILLQKSLDQYHLNKMNKKLFSQNDENVIQISSYGSINDERKQI